MSKDNGGQAFPGVTKTTERGGPHGDKEQTTHHEGMTLRDWFAGQAPVDWEMARLAGGIPVVVTKADRPRLWGAMAALRYEYADAMLAARKC